MSSPRFARHRDFVVLDGIRGLAATVVVLGHVKNMTSMFWPPNYFLAVDLFFLLSGFVIGLAYEERLRGSLSVRSFLLARIIRLYPMYLLGTVLYAPVGVIYGEIPSLSLPEAISSAIPTMFMLPVRLSSVPWFLFPYNPVAWSLMLEVFANLIFAFYIARMRNTHLLAICMGSLVAMALNVLYFREFNVGFNWGNALGGVSRVFFSFFLHEKCGRKILPNKFRTN